MTDKTKMRRLIIFIVGGVFLASCIVALLLLNGSIWAKFVGCYDLVCDRESIHQLVKSSGWAAPLIFVAIQIGQVLFAPIPGDVTGFLGATFSGLGTGFSFQPSV
jgi:uncharacterized membrane protein YdjX (TVP38/TMEM64 family)